MLIFAPMKRTVFIGWLLLLSLTACHNPQREAKPCPQEDMLYQMESFFGQKPDSVLQILDTLNIKVFSEKERAHYCLLKVKVRDVLFLYDNETDSLLQVAENYFIGNRDKWFETETYVTLSRIASMEGKGEQIKLDWLQKALQSIEQCHHVDKRLIQFHPIPVSEQEFIENHTYTLHRLLGMTYSEFNYMEEGHKHLKIADLHFEKTQEYEQRSEAAYSLGHSYLAMGEYDSCLMCYHNGLEAAKKAGNIKQCAYYHHCMCMFYKYKHGHQNGLNAEEKQQLLRKCVAECKKGLALLNESPDYNKVAYYSGLSNTYYFLHEYDSCIYFSNKEIDLITNSTSVLFPHEVYVGVLYRIYKSYVALDDKENALRYADMYLKMREQLEDQHKAFEQVKNEYDKKLEIMQLRSEQQAKRYRLYLLLALTLVALMLVLWLFFHYRKNKEIEALRFHEANLQLQSELEQASQHSQQVLQQRAMNLYKTEGDKAWESIVADFETTYPHAMENLKAAHPDLTDAERNIVILSFLGFRTKEEAEILHLSLNTVEKYRTNIRKKSGSAPISLLIR